MLKIKNIIANKKLLINLFNCSLISASILIVFLIANKSIEFGSESGGWCCAYFNDFTIQPIIIFLSLAPYIIFFTYLSCKYIDKYEIFIIILWIIIGLIIQLIIRQDTPHPIDQVIEIDNFYTTTFKYSAYELLSNHKSIVDTLPIHAKANMPGKILFFHLLRIFTSSTQIMALLIMIVSNIGGVLIYFISKFLFNVKKIALYSLILYLFIPAKIFHFPVLNTVTPVFMLLSLFLMIKYLNTLKKVYLVFLGISLYVLFIFEPLPFSAGIIFLSVVVYYLHNKKIKIRHLINLIGYSILVLIITFFIFLWIFKYNAIDNFIFIFNDAVHFNEIARRSYEIWVVQNLKNFFINVGVLQSAIFFVFLSYILYRIIVNIKNFGNVTPFIVTPGMLLTLSVLLTIFIVDLIGINRGEIIRQWIFITVFFPVIVAYYCVKIKTSLTFYIVLLGTILQSAVSSSMVEF